MLFAAADGAPAHEFQGLLPTAWPATAQHRAVERNLRVRAERVASLWSQRYFEDTSLWGGPGFPVFLSLGGEGPVGGCGAREDMWAAYEAAGGETVNPKTARWWETFGALHWGVIIESMGAWIRAGADLSVERHVIARRASETELLIIADLTGREI